MDSVQERNHAGRAAGQHVRQLFVRRRQGRAEREYQCAGVEWPYVRLLQRPFPQWAAPAHGTLPQLQGSHPGVRGQREQREFAARQLGARAHLLAASLLTRRARPALGKRGLRRHEQDPAERAALQRPAPGAERHAVHRERLRRARRCGRVVLRPHRRGRHGQHPVLLPTGRGRSHEGGLVHPRDGRARAHLRVRRWLRLGSRSHASRRGSRVAVLFDDEHVRVDAARAVGHSRRIPLHRHAADLPELQRADPAFRLANLPRGEHLRHGRRARDHLEQLLRPGRRGRCLRQRLQRQRLHHRQPLHRHGVERHSVHGEQQRRPQPGVRLRRRSCRQPAGYDTRPADERLPEQLQRHRESDSRHRRPRAAGGGRRHRHGRQHHRQPQQHLQHAARRYQRRRRMLGRPHDLVQRRVRHCALHRGSRRVQQLGTRPLLGHQYRLTRVSGWQPTEQLCRSSTSSTRSR